MIDSSKVSYLTVDAESDGQRLDNYLIRLLKGVPKSLVYRIVRSGEVRVNKRRADVAQRVVAGDEIRIPPVRLAEAPPQLSAAVAARGPTLPILYEDDVLLVVNKPAGVAVHGGSGISFGVIEQLRAMRPQARFLELVHRLDRDTSGILLVAKRRSALVAMHELLREDRGMDKRYLALVAGRFPDAKRNVRFKLHKYTTADGERRVNVSPDGQPSHTVLLRRRQFAEATLLECELKTGRTHQIRVHCAQSGFPILGDDKYGDFARNRQLTKEGLRRMFLHAWRLTLPHPQTGQPLALEAPLPAELQSYLDSLEAASRQPDSPETH